MLADEAGVSHHTLAAMRNRHSISNAALLRIAIAAERLRGERDLGRTDVDTALRRLREMEKQLGGRNSLAVLLGYDATYVGRVLAGKKPVTAEMQRRIRKLQG